MFECYNIVKSAVQKISTDLWVCSKCSKYLENDISDKYKLKLWTASKARSDWLLNLRISFVIHLPRNSREICVRTNYNRCRNKWVKPYFCVLLSHCFSPHYSPLCRWLAVGIYHTALVKSFNWYGSREICVRTNYNRCRNKWVKPYFCVLLSHCFSPHYSPLCRWLAVGIYRAALVKSF